jgi:hypothetical protein
MEFQVKKQAMNGDTLLNLGFVDTAVWKIDGGKLHYELTGLHAVANQIRFDTKNALYACVRDDDVMYIGTTARTIRKRFVGYCNPGKRQATNIRCNKKIQELLDQGLETKIFVFNPIADLRYSEFELNIAAGLEDSLIAAFEPPWNGREKGQAITEEAEREAAEENSADKTSTEPLIVSPPLSREPHKAFPIKLGEAYYNQGIINPGVDASRELGEHGEPIQVSFSDGSEPVLSTINRTANKSGSVRVVGGNSKIAKWVQNNFVRGDTIEGRVMDKNRITIGKF